jgi:hypothetical protein
MDILIVLVALVLIFLFAVWSGVRSYLDRGRSRGMEEATREIIRGISSHYEHEGRVVPSSVAEAIEAVKSIALARPRRAAPYHARPWVFGDSVGEACWRRGYESGLREMSPRSIAKSVTAACMAGSLRFSTYDAKLSGIRNSSL